MRKGINFAQLPATFPRKVSKENISNNCYHASKDIDMFMQIKSVKGNIEGKSKKPRLNVHRAYLHFGRDPEDVDIQFDADSFMDTVGNLLGTYMHSITSNMLS